MVIIHEIDDSLISLEISSSENIPTASYLLSKIREDLFIDWEFIFEELNETVDTGIERKVINIMIMNGTNRDKMVVVSVKDYELVAVIPS
ncbi:hypothetical protein GWK41_09515 [Persephonella atlantica]|uniref:Uncharacterized protein n=1 Tax=Persephonella atlantica TaxID=2699429 RepID=A0ABS1GKF4_9AQUI|nr:hypothetical protein [Persephonella atlantica]MBK3333306.1 hypothetical protein [Persephonella atlantica]